MVNDVAPDLAKAIEKSFERRMSNDKTVQRILRHVRDGTVTQAEVSAYAGRVGIAGSGALREVLVSEALPDGKLYWNIAERTILPQLERQHSLVNVAARTAQTAYNKQTGLGISSPVTSINIERVRGIMNMACADGANLDAVLGEPVITMARSAYDGFQEEAVSRMQSLGVQVIVRRDYDGVGLHDGKTPCSWCMERAGVFEGYSEAKDAGAFERHDGCGCTVEVIYDNGVSADPWSKATWETGNAEERAETIEAVRQERLNFIADRPSRVREREVYIREQVNRGMTVKSAVRSYYNKSR